MNEERIKQVIEAKKQIADAAITIWNTRLELLVSAGDTRGVLDQLRVPVEEAANNCNCTNTVIGCGPQKM